MLLDSKIIDEFEQEYLGLVVEFEDDRDIYFNFGVLSSPELKSAAMQYIGREKDGKRLCSKRIFIKNFG